ncbi:MAG: hypothetical protein HY756_04735 [Nitrospirae bacterium]|nr:hypothetical protein [Nitrospirota bacterium]
MNKKIVMRRILLMLLSFIIAGAAYPMLVSGEVIPKTNWTLKYADSQETVSWNGAATNGFDNNSATIWHTKWNGGSSRDICQLGSREGSELYTKKREVHKAEGNNRG